MDFPAPPLGLAKTMVGVADETADDLLTNNKRADHRQAAGRLITDRKLIADQRITDCRQTVHGLLAAPRSSSAGGSRSERCSNSRFARPGA